MSYIFKLRPSEKDDRQEYKFGVKHPSQPYQPAVIHRAPD